MTNKNISKDTRSINNCIINSGKNITTVDQRHHNDVAGASGAISFSCNIVKKRKTMYRRAGEILVQYALEVL